MRLVFMGTPEFALPSLEALLDAGYQIDTVVTGPDKPRGRGRDLQPTPVKATAAARGLRIIQPASTRDPAFADDLRSRAPDLIVVVAFRILPPAVIAIPRLGAFNLHASLLPRHRGAAPINWALINGETRTGVTTFFLEEHVDTGVIIHQRAVDIRPDDDAGSLHDRLSVVGASLVVDTVRDIESGTAPRRAQNPGLATPAPKIFREHCRIDWEEPAEAVRNRIRGLSPHPAAYAVHRGSILKIYRADIEPSVSDLEPGAIRRQGESLLVGTGTVALSIREIQQEGKRRMGIGEFLRGYRLAPADRFDPAG